MESYTEFTPALKAVTTNPVTTDVYGRYIVDTTADRLIVDVTFVWLNADGSPAHGSGDWYMAIPTSELIDTTIATTTGDERRIGFGYIGNDSATAADRWVQFTVVAKSTTEVRFLFNRNSTTEYGVLSDAENADGGDSLMYFLADIPIQ